MLLWFFRLLYLGAESSRPGAPALDTDIELTRLLPVLRAAVTLGVPISVDTYKPAVMAAALDLGADIINDIWALRQTGAQPGAPDALSVVAAHPHCGVCLMHMHGEPATMQLTPMPEVPSDAANGKGMDEPRTVIGQVRDFLQQRTEALCAKGVAANRISWDMGIGFGKTVDQNVRLLAGQAALLESGFPLLVGWSRKSSLGALTGLPVGERLIPSVAAALLAVERGARIVRVHDVKETVAALAVWNALGEKT